MESFVGKVLAETTVQSVTAQELLEAAEKIFMERENYYETDWKQYPAIEKSYRRDVGNYLLGIAEFIDTLLGVHNVAGKGIPYPQFLCVDTDPEKLLDGTPEGDDPWGDYIGSYC